MPTEIEHMPIYIQSSKSVFKTNNNKPSDKEIKKPIKKLRNNKESFDIEAELLKIAFSLNSITNFSILWKKSGIRNASPKNGVFITHEWTMET